MTAVLFYPLLQGGKKALFTSPLNGKKISFKFGDSEALKAIYRPLSHTLCARVLTNGFSPFYMTIKQKKQRIVGKHSSIHQK